MNTVVQIVVVENQTAASLLPNPLQWERDKKVEIMGWDNNLLQKKQWEKENK